MRLEVMTLGLVLLVLAACADAPSQSRSEPSEADLERIAAEYNAKVDDPMQHIVCEKEARIGTRIKDVVCRTRAQMEYEQKEGRRYFDKPRPVPTVEGARVPGG